MGMSDIATLTADYRDCTPQGYIVQFKGCPVEHHGTRSFCRVEHGQVVTAIFVEDNTAATGPQPPADESPDESDPSSDPETDASLNSNYSPRSPAPRENTDRSRSPRGPPPPAPVNQWDKGPKYLLTQEAEAICQFAPEPARTIKGYITGTLPR